MTVRSEWHQQLQSAPFCHVDGVSCSKGPGRKGLFFTVPRGNIWETSWTGFGFPLPACSFCCPQWSDGKTQPSSLLGQIPFVFYPGSHLRGLIFRCGPVLHSRPPDRLRRNTTSHCARGAVKCLVALATTPGVPLIFAVLREACVESRPGGTVSARALCLRKIRANDGRCSFEARLTFEIVEKATFFFFFLAQWHKSALF